MLFSLITIPSCVLTAVQADLGEVPFRSVHTSISHQSCCHLHFVYLEINSKRAALHCLFISMICSSADAVLPYGLHVTSVSELLHRIPTLSGIFEWPHFFLPHCSLCKGTSYLLRRLRYVSRVMNLHANFLPQAVRSKSAPVDCGPPAFPHLFFFLFLSW